MNIQYQNHNPNIPSNNSNSEGQKHVHEIHGSVQTADNHEHRFVTMTGESIPFGMDHYHEIMFRTDFYEDHFHEFYGRSTGVIPIGNRHVHYLESVTTENDNHSHKFRFATMIDNPSGE